MTDAVMPAVDHVAPLQFTLKVVSRCNLDCRYCYVYNGADDSWRKQPAVMSDEVLAAAAERIRRHCIASGQATVDVVFHGGEPTIAGPERFDRWCHTLHARLGDITTLRLTLQTNGTLLDATWTEVLSRHGVEAGISLDGPEDVNDEQRVDAAGRGSYRRVVAGIEHLKAAGLVVNLLTVVRFGTDSVRTHRHLAGLGARSIAYILPDHTHDTIGPVRRRFGPHPCADFLIPVFDEWWFEGTMSTAVNPFLAIARSILGGQSRVDFLGNRPYGFIFIEADGTIEGLDVLKVCGQGLAATGLNVFEHDFTDVAARGGLHAQAIFAGLPLPAGCAACPERFTCAGGYLPHRFSRARGFDNPSVWSEDMLRLFRHIRSRLDVTVEETHQRWQLLGEMRSEATSPGCSPEK